MKIQAQKGPAFAISGQLVYDTPASQLVIMPKFLIVKSSILSNFGAFYKTRNDGISLCEIKCMLAAYKEDCM